MFNLEIEKKIVNFVKNSPIGVTSRDIASYVGLNRMTITKYLAIIKERTLIDFKQFGMAKLWYIPVNLNKESFLSKITTNIAANIPKEQFKTISNKVGISLGEEINQMYLKFNDVKKLSLDQITDAYDDIGKKLNGNFKAKLAHDRISIEIIESPFEEDNIQIMNTILSAVFAKIASLNLGYARAVVSEPKDQNVVIDVYLKKVEK
ncbi:MAG: hypothetical protein IH934_07825 [Nanoarchaeota archaeon]|nr:hypothetical protein [Nanoarchaeota archaeon]